MPDTTDLDLVQKVIEPAVGLAAIHHELGQVSCGLELRKIFAGL